MQLLGAAQVRGGFGPDAVEGGGVEPAERLGVQGQAASQLHGPRPALLERSVVEEGEGLAVEDLVRQHGRLGRLHEVHAHRSGLHAPEQGHEPVDVHGLVQAVEERLAHQDVVGDHHRATRRVLLAGRQRGEDRRHEVVGLHALDRQGVLLAAPEAQHRQGAVEVPAPSGGEHRRRQHRLAKNALGRLRSQQPGGAVEGEAVLGAEREHHRVVIGGGLELEVEGGAEALAQRQAQAPVDAAAQRGVHHHLHAARLVEEPFEHDVVSGRERAQLAQTQPPGTGPAARPRRRRARTPPRHGSRRVDATGGSAIAAVVGEELADGVAQD